MSLKNCPSNIYKHTNNAFNIRHNPNNWWQGQTGQYKGFCIFKDDWYSLRALLVLLRNYRIRYNIDKIKDIINRYAPPTENNTEKYITDVCVASSISPDDLLSALNYDEKTKFVLAIARIETNVRLDYEMVFQTIYLLE